jgi:hypothetical protein
MTSHAAVELRVADRRARSHVLHDAPSLALAARKIKNREYTQALDRHQLFAR